MFVPQLLVAQALPWLGDVIQADEAEVQVAPHISDELQSIHDRLEIPK